MSLQVNIRHLEEKDLRFAGQLPAADLELDAVDELVKARQPLHFDLTAQRTGPNVLVRGRLEMTLDCECARCLKPFPFRFVLPDWSVVLPLEGPEKVAVKDDCLDLTPHLREDILLEFPQHPLCGADCAGLPNRKVASSQKTGKSGEAQNTSAWAELNKLKF